ncbi:MAG: hypothetical protein WD225_03095 [Ilumatobacteraceae bacterium]
MLSSFDDFPVHQTSHPVSRTATTDLNHYDRYFFNGYTRDHDGADALYFGCAMGLYPNRHVADAAFSVVVGGTEQISVHASRRAPDDRRDANDVGPIRVEVVEPLKTLRVLVDAPNEGLRAELTFRSRSAPLEEPHFHHQVGNRVLLDYTRLTQFGRWEGWVEVGGKRFVCSPADTWGSRDRSWGIRPVGERAPAGAPVADPQFYWLWAPINFGNFATHVDVNETASGARWHETGFVAPDAEPAMTATAVRYDIAWRPGTRWARSFELDLDTPDGTTHVSLEPLYDFQMCGVGYGHPEWAHGVWKGELEVSGERWSLPVADPCALHHVHVQTVCRARARAARGTHEGIGILETYVIGPHEPTGLTGIVDPA